MVVLSKKIPYLCGFCETFMYLCSTNKQLLVYMVNLYGLDLWLKETDFGKFGKHVVLVHELFIDYSYFCHERSIGNVATSRRMSDFLEMSGYKKIRTCTGMAFAF